MYVHRNILAENYHGKHDSDEGLGVITALIGAIAALVPLVVKWVGNKQDQWSKWPAATKNEYVRQGLIVAADAVLKGRAQSVEQVLQPIIAQVVKKDSWQQWLSKNPYAVTMINEAKAEIAAAKNHQCKKEFSYVVCTPGQMQAGFLGGSLSGWLIAFLLIGGIAYGIKNKEKVFKNQLKR